MAPRIHNTLSYSFSAIVFSLQVPWSNPEVALVGALWNFHFVRRTLEAMFVHRFSGRQVPPADFVVEYLYYWGFASWIAWGIRDPGWELPSTSLIVLGGFVFSVGELGNAWIHQKLRALRKQSGDTTKSIPHGGPFNWVSCPHYLFEIVSWCGFLIVTQILSAAIFALAGAAITSSYALSRHRKYRVEFDGQEGRPKYPDSRKAIFPLVL